MITNVAVPDGRGHAALYARSDCWRAASRGAALSIFRTRSSDSQCVPHGIDLPPVRRQPRPVILRVSRV